MWSNNGVTTVTASAATLAGSYEVTSGWGVVVSIIVLGALAILAIVVPTRLILRSRRRREEAGADEPSPQ